MKIIKRLICAALAAVTMLAGAPAFAANTGKTANYWRIAPVVEGHKAYCWNEAGQQTFYLLYENTVCAPLRTVAEWMGKDLVKEATGNVFTLSGSKTPLFRDQRNIDKGEQRVFNDLSGDAYLAKLAEPVPITVLSNARLVLDGKAVTVIGAENKPASLFSWEGDVYIPLQTAAKMMNMVMNHVVRTPILDGKKLPVIESIYIRTKLTDAQLAECKAYVNTLYPVLDSFLNETLNPHVSTMETAEAAVNKMISDMMILKNTPKPDVRLLDVEYAKMQAAADEALQIYRKVQQMILNKEDLKKIQYAIHVDHDLKNYPTGPQGSAYRPGAKKAGADAVQHVLYLYNYVYEI